MLSCVQDKYRLLLGERRTLFRAGLRLLLEEDFAVIGESGSFETLLAMAGALGPHIVLLNMLMDMNPAHGLAAVELLAAESPETSVLVLGDGDEPDAVATAFAAGASGYLLRESEPDDLFDAVRAVGEGRAFVSAELAGAVATSLAVRGRGNGSGEILTARQTQILRLTAEGRSSKEIGQLLRMSHRTVEHHRANIKTRLNLRHRADLVRYALEHRYL